MGRSQRQKGCRGEYKLRDELRRFGFQADRVPASGAAQGAAFKGDVRFSRNGKNYTAEMKSRKNSFQSLYAMYDAYQATSQDDTLKFIDHEGGLVNLSSSPLGALEPGGVYEFAYNYPWYQDHRRTVARFKTLKKLLGESDLLCVKDNNRPILYIRWR